MKLIRWCLAAVAVASAGCQSDVPDPQPGTRSTSDVFETIREVALEEPAGLPITGIDDFAVLSDGRFVVVDSKSGQIRLHGRRGDLIRIASARGEGPGEFRRPLRVAAVAAGGFVAMESSRLEALDDEWLLVQHARFLESPDNSVATLFDWRPYAFDAYTLDGARILEDVALPGRILAADSLAYILVEEPPQPWVVALMAPRFDHPS